MKPILLLILFLLCSVCFAQPQYSAQVKACVGEEGVMLRWAPTDVKSWQAGLRLGYVVERYTIMQGDEILSVGDIAAQKVRTAPIKVQPLEAWEAYADDKYVAIAAECTYGKGESAGALSPTLIYKHQQQRQQRFSFALYAADMSPRAALLSGLMMHDRKIDKNAKYLYKVYIASPDTVAQDTALVFVNAKIATPLANLHTPTLTWKNKMVDIALDLTYSHDYTSYVVERSVNGGQTWQTIDDNPTINIAQTGSLNDMLYITDTLPDNSTIMQYRIYGIDCFGRSGPTTEIVEGHGVMPLSAAPQIVRCEAIDNNRVEIEWSFPDSLIASTTGFRVYRQTSVREKLKKIMECQDANLRTFTDIMPATDNYYRISAYNSDTEKLMTVSKYVALVDSFPPVAPVGLVGSIDTTGIAEIRWQRNAERDLSGYRVYVANLPTDEFSLLTPKILIDSLFRYKVNLNTLTHAIYYQVRAIDKHDNHSEPSATLKLMRPDTIAPVAPVLNAIAEKDEHPALSWICSTSDDVVRHIIIRKSDIDDATADTIATLNNIQNTYVDKDAERGMPYTYAIYAQDEAGNKSTLVKRYFEPSHKTVAQLSLKVSNEAGINKLTWTLSARKKVAKFAIFRADNDGSLLPYVTTDKQTYRDVDIIMGHKYKYAVQIIFADGSQSELYY